MKKVIKIMSILALVLIIGMNFVNAIDLNLTENGVTDTSLDSINEDNYNSTISTSTTVKTGNTLDSGLNLSNILSIFLIVVGILIVLLAIAILIKIK